MHRIITVLALAGLVLAGCAADDDTDPTASPTPTETTSPTDGDTPADDGDDPDASPSPSSSEEDDDPEATPTPTASDGDDGVAAMTFTDCAAADLTVSYPAEWATNDPAGLADACRVFHPGQVDLPDEPQGISLHWAVLLNIDNVPFEDRVDAERSGEVLQEREVTVDGRDARVFEVRSVGQALVPEGETRYGYTVDLGERTLSASTYTVGDTDYERDKQVLDRMMESLRLTTAE